MALKQKKTLEEEHSSEIQNLKEAHLQEVQGLKSEIEELKKQIALKDHEHDITKAQLQIQTENVVKQTTTTNNVNVTVNNLGELTPELGKLLADKITLKQFWEGQRAIGKTLRDLRDDESRPYFMVKDENRMKYEVREGEELRRDDRAERIIETVKEPVSSKIDTIKSNLISNTKDTSFATRVLDQALDCLNFQHPKENRRFLQGLSSKNG